MDIKHHMEFIKKMQRIEIKNQIEEVRYYKKMIVIKGGYCFREYFELALKELRKLLKNRHKVKNICKSGF